MKKVIKIIMIIILIILFGLGVLFGYKYLKDNKSGVQSKLPLEPFSLEWKHMNVEEEIFYIPNSHIETKEEILLCGFSQDGYIPINVPNRQTVNLFGSSVYAVDGSFSIIISKDSNNSIASTIIDPMRLDKNIMCTSDGDDAVHVISKSFGDYVITGYVYSNSIDWSVIRDQIVKSEIRMESRELTNVSHTTLEEIEQAGSQSSMLAEITESMVPTDTYLTDGVIRSMMYPITYTKAIQQAEKYIALMSDGDVVTYYSDDNITFISNDNFSIGIMSSKTDGYVNILFGFGNQAKINIQGLII